MTALLEVTNLVKGYANRHGQAVRAINDVSFTLASGEVLGVVGESGCGKTTLGRAVLRLVEPDSGAVRFQGRDLLQLSRAEMKRARRDLQIVFQDPFGSLNPRHKVSTIDGEPIVVHGDGLTKDRVAEMLSLVGLPADAGERYPHEFSGGQRQRIAIARALALHPKLLVADEPVSALDVSIQSQIINLIADLRARFGLSMIFISHDLSVIRHVSDRIAVMYAGKIVETGSAAEVFERPQHDYTRTLLAAIPKIRRRA
jgi:peptide/nickel transport system ATP-binding protein/oligopeptide transport system ATP-binding protein